MRTLHLCIFILLAATSSQAAITPSSIFIEPSIGYRSQIINMTDLTNTTTQIKSVQPNFGLKLGYRSSLGIDLNLTGEYMTGKADVSNQADKTGFSHKSAGVQIGVNSLGLVKMYLGTSFLNDFKLDDNGATPGFTLSGPSFQAGLQFNLFPLVSIGLQYTLNQFDTIKGAAYTADSKTSTYFNKIDTQDYSLYLSIPL